MVTKRQTKPSCNREEETRAEILSTGRRLARKYGVQKLTMEDVAAACGKTRSFLYYYYPGKRALVRALLEAEFTEIREHVRSAVDKEQSAVAKLRTFIQTRLEEVVRQVTSVGLATIVQSLEGGLAGADLTTVLAMRQAVDQEETVLVANLLKLGVKEGAFRPLSAELYEDVAYFLLSALRGVELELALAPDTERLVRPRLAKVLDVLMRGLNK
jgi:AcrR family transcriptional regulator